MHPSRDELSGFVLGTLEDQVADQVADHIDHCPQCEETLRQIETASDTFIQTLKLPAVEIPHSGETGCRELVQVIQAIGREPSFTSPGSVAVATDQEDLGSLGHYRLLAKLGEGGMGTVYKALHTNLDRVVAIKVLPSDRMQNEDAVSRFQREMKAVGKLHHPNIVIAHDAGEVDGTHYLVMELVDGIDLSALVRRVGPVCRSRLPSAASGATEYNTAQVPSGRRDLQGAMTVADACEMIRQAAVGLQEAHEDGMVHRDIKPSNLMLARSRKGRKPPLVKILDLGLALLDDQQGQRRDLTSTGQMMGTLDYMAPEQGGDSHEVDIRADIYALGATLYKLLCGHPPFAGERYNTHIKMIRALALESPPSIGEMRDDLPVELVAVVDRMLAKDPDDRFAEPEEVAEALPPFCEGFDLASLLKKATAEGAESTEDESKVATHESLKSGSVETAPTIDAPIDSPLPEGAEPVGPDGPAGPDEIARTESIQRPARCATGSASEEPRQPKPALAKPVAPVAPSKARSPKGEGRWYTNPRNQILVAAGLGGIILLAAILFYIKTDHATIVVEIHDPSISVTVNGEDILISDPTVTVDPSSKTHKQAGQPIKLRPGEHTLHITYGELEFDTDKFKLRRGDKVVLSAKLTDGQVKVVHDDQVIGRKLLHGQNHALEFDGKTGYVDIPSLVYGGGEVTVEAMVSLPGENDGCIAVCNDNGGNQIGLYRSYRAPPLFSVRDNDPTVHDARGGKNYSSYSGRRVHIAGVWDGTNVRLYVNGTRDHSGGFLHSPKPVVLKPGLRIAARVERNTGAPGAFYYGVIDEVHISKVARYDKDFAPPKPGERFEPDEHTLALYHFDEGQGEVAHDSSGNNHHGKIVGAKWVIADSLSSGDREREVAEWVLAMGGYVAVHDPSGGFSSLDVGSLEALPAERFVVTTVDLTACERVRDDDLARLKLLKQLRILHLSDTKITDECLVHLKDMTSLRQLNLHRTGVTDDGLKCLQGLTNLDYLQLDGTDITTEGLECLRTLPIEVLAVAECRVSSQDLARVTSWFTNLKQLAVDGAQFTGEGGKSVFALEKLKILSIGPAKGADVQLLEKMRNLEVLMFFAGDGDACLEFVRDLDKLASLSVGRGATNSGLIHMRDLPSLESLDLNYNDSITNDGLTYLEELKHLKHLQLLGTSVSVEGIAQLHLSLPKCKIESDFTDEEIAAAVEKLNGDATTDPLSKTAIVKRPARLDGVQSWTIETPGPRGVVRALEYSPDGSLLASAGDDGAIRLWNSKTGDLERILLGHDSVVTGLSWSPDGSRIATSSWDKTVRIWDATNGKLFKTLTDHKDWVLDVDWSHDGNTIASVGQDGKLVLCDVGTWMAHKALELPALANQRYACVAWSGDDKLIAASLSGHTVLISSSETGEVVQKLEIYVDRLAWAPNSHMLLTVVGREHRFRLWNAYTAELLSEVDTGVDVKLPGWTPDGTELIIAGFKGEIQYWNIEQKKQLRQLTMPVSRGILSIAVAPDGESFACGGDNARIEVFSSEDEKQSSVLHRGQQNYVRDASWSPDGSLLAMTSDVQPVGLWNASTGSMSQRLEQTQTQSNRNDALAWSPDGITIAAGNYDARGVVLWKSSEPGVFEATPTVLLVGSGPELAWSAKGTFLASCGTHTVDIIDTDSSEVLHRWTHDRERITATSWSPSIDLLASGGTDNTVRIWDAETGEMRSKIEAHPGSRTEVIGIAWSPDGKALASVGQDASVAIWDTQTGQLVNRLRGHEGRQCAVTWLADNNTVVLFTDDGKCRFWDTTSGQLLKEIDGPKLSGGDFSPDKSLLAAKLFNSVEFWDLQAAKSVGTIVLLTDDAWLTCAPEGHYRGSPRVHRSLVYVVQTESGQETLTPDEFTKKYGWKNDPEKVKLTE